VDSQNISSKNLTVIIEPFIISLANCRNRILNQRIKDSVIIPLLENNVTVEVDGAKSAANEPRGKYDLLRDEEIRKLID